MDVEPGCGDLKVVGGGRDHGGEGLNWKIGDHGEGDEERGTRSCIPRT